MKFTRFELRTIAKRLAVGLLASAVLLLVVDYCDAKRGGGGRGGGGRGGIGVGGGGFGGGGFHHRPSGGGSYHRPGRGFDGRAHIDNSLPGRPGSGLPDRPGNGRPDKPGGGNGKPDNGGGHDQPSGIYDNYYYGWDDPTYGYGAMAVGSYVHSVPTDCVYEQLGGLTYRRCGDVWYEPRYEDAGVRYVVVERPF